MSHQRLSALSQSICSGVERRAPWLRSLSAASHLTIPRRNASLPAVHTPEGMADASSLLSPAVMFLVRTESIDPSSIKGTGRAGRLLKGDVLHAIQTGTAKRLSPAEQTRATGASSAQSPTSAASDPPSLPIQQGPRYTESGRRNRSAMFQPSPPTPPSTKMQAIDVPSKAASRPPPPPPSSPSPVQSAPPSPPFRGRARTHEDVALTNMRKVTASRLLQSKQTIPHSYVSQSVDMTAAIAFRASLKAQGVTPLPSVNDLIIRASALSLRRHPSVNAVLGKDAEYAVSPTVDVSVAVATPTGLLTPIVARADRLRLTQISAVVKDLAARARSNQLKLQEFQGGSFTISNLGMYGLKAFAAIINPPQACILAVGGNTDEAHLMAGSATSLRAAAEVPPVYSPKPAAPAPTYSTPASNPSGAQAAALAAAVADVGTASASAPPDVSFSPMLSLTLVFDERAIDAEEGGKFLDTLKSMLQQPESML